MGYHLIVKESPMWFITAFCILFIILLAFKDSPAEAGRSASRILLTVIAAIIVIVLVLSFARGCHIGPAGPHPGSRP